MVGPAGTAGATGATGRGYTNAGPWNSGAGCSGYAVVTDANGSTYCSHAHFASESQRSIHEPIGRPLKPVLATFCCRRSTGRTEAGRTGWPNRCTRLALRAQPGAVGPAGATGARGFTRAQGPTGATGANGTNLTDSDRRTSSEVKLIGPPT
jgi:hypothetical protein